MTEYEYVKLALTATADGVGYMIVALSAVALFMSAMIAFGLYVFGGF